MSATGSGLRPTFLVIGAYKAGTTSLHHYLKQHPQVFMSPIKEIRFLTYAGHQRVPLSEMESVGLRWGAQSLSDYEALFAEAADTPARGDVSPCYLAFAVQSILGIQAYVPDARLIAILRQPADRAYSSYVGLVRSGREEVMDFRHALQLEAGGQLRRLDGRQRRDFAESFYFDSLLRYSRRFPREQMRFYLYEDLQEKALWMMQDIFRFIGVDSAFVPDMSIHHNTGAWPRLAWAPLVTRRAEHLVRRIIRLFPMPLCRRTSECFTQITRTSPPPLDPEQRKELTKLYREDILRTQELIDRDLSHWLE